MCLCDYRYLTSDSYHISDYLISEDYLNTLFTLPYHGRQTVADATHERPLPGSLNGHTTVPSSVEHATRSYYRIHVRYDMYSTYCYCFRWEHPCHPPDLVCLPSLFHSLVATTSLRPLPSPLSTVLRLKVVVLYYLVTM